MQQYNDLFLMKNPHDHIMANTWRLIFERGPQTPLTQAGQHDLSKLEKLLPEYRLIGFALASSHKKQRIMN
ncbi:MAG: hypothetical protein KDJ65_05885 [Anaerolineae bacterium]|nr:hypothetical protein [Anaerolineae bacterium]